MPNYEMAQQIILHMDQVNELIARYGGFFINYHSCVADCMFLARVHPSYSNQIVSAIENMGFILGDVRVLGMQTYIYLRGYML